VLLQPGTTCWRSARSPRAALLIDMAAYFDAAKIAMSNAKRSVHLLNWAFEPDTYFHPEPGCTGQEDDQFGNFLVALARNPKLDVRLLCWKSALPVASTQHFFPLADRRKFAGTGVKFVLDGKLPIGAAHHQKMIIIDDAIAFCGGGDIGPDRWDTPEHLDDNPRREKTRYDNKWFDSRHEVMALVDGDPARILGELFRERWLRATGEAMEAPTTGEPEAWPQTMAPMFDDIQVGLSRTAGAWRKYPQVREVEALHIAAIEAARDCIYMENQYFTAPVIAQALARRLRDPKGPEVILVSAEHSPSYFDQMTMDKTRSGFIKQLQAADRHGRLRVYSPVTALGKTIIVHAKLTIIDDVLLRIGSANLNNRSMGFDTECDLSLEASGRGAPKNRKVIAGVRTHLLAHWLGCADRVVEDAVAREGSIGAGIEALRHSGYCRLRPIEAKPLHPLAAFVAEYHLGDPIGAKDSWRPWKRKRAVGLDERRVKRKVAG
jgi:phosphatidylserine/phosphatidylglycerophosphate/cardiolipin synthase-like enzyme